MRPATVLAICIVWRVLISVCTQTFFQPDEFFQSLEVAHQTVFGYGHLTWEWRIQAPIRSILFPSLYIPSYWLAKALKLDDGPALIFFPKIAQGLLASLTDCGTFLLARRTIGERYAFAALFLSLTSFFHILSLSRTLSNSVETSFTVLALCFWPWIHSPSKRQLFAAYSFAALSCIIRPTSAVLWAYLSVALLWRARSNTRILRNQVLVIISVGILSCCAMLIADSFYFGKWVFTPLNFLRTNLSSVSLFYGRCPWHYYLTQGLPLLLTTSTPFFVAGAWKSVRSGPSALRQLTYAIIWTIGVFSVAGHKEWRFLHPLLPAMLVVASSTVMDPITKSRTQIDGTGIPLKHAFFISIGLLPGIYTTFYHSRAQIGVLGYLRSLEPSNVKSIGFLMPCHSTPWQSHLHRPHLSSPGLMWSIGCEPPLGGQNLDEYRDQTNVFYADPLRYIQERFPNAVDEAFPVSPYPATVPGSPKKEEWVHAWPSHLVLFGALLREHVEIEPLIKRLGYRQVWSGSNGWEEDRRRRGGVQVWVYTTKGPLQL